MRVWFYGMLTLGCMVGLVNLSVAQERVYVVGVEAVQYFPHFDNDDGKEYLGYAREVLDLFAAWKGYQFRYQILPVKRLFMAFVNKEIDFKYPDHPYWQAEMKKSVKVFYSKPVVGFVDGVMVLPERKGLGVTHLKDLGTVRGFTPWDYLDLIEAKKVTVQEQTSFIALLQKTLLNRVDGAYINVAVAQYQLKEILKNPGALVFDPGLPHTQSGYAFSSILHPQVIEEMNQFLAEKQEQIRQLQIRYGVLLE